MPELIRPKYVCIYWRDIQLGYHKYFLENGFEVVTAGHMYDKLFFYRLKEILLNFETVIVSELGSHVFYAHQCGLNIISPEKLTYKHINKESILSSFYDNDEEKKSINNIKNKFEEINEYFIELFKENLTLNDQKKDFLNTYSNRLNNRRFIFLIIHFFSWMVYKIKPKGWYLHLFDFLYLKLDKFIKRNIIS